MEESMRKRLEAVKTRCEEIDRDLSDPAIMNNVALITELSKERSSLSEAYEGYQEYLKAESDLKDADDIINSGDPELAEMMKLEKKSLVGGDEANIFAGDLLRMYTRYAENQGWKVQYIDGEEGSAGGYSYVSFMVKGKNVYSKLKFESGAHRVQRVPKTEASGRIHTSTATVLVMPEAEEVDVKINPTDLKIDTYRSQGAIVPRVLEDKTSTRPSPPSVSPTSQPESLLAARPKRLSSRTKKSV